jgi:hypothetical protein
VRCLYDLANGGPPRAFECLLIYGKGLNDVSHAMQEARQYFMLREGFRPCGAVTRTLRGMKSHLWLVHKFVAQGELFRELEAKGNSDAISDHD